MPLSSKIPITLRVFIYDNRDSHLHCYFIHLVNITAVLAVNTNIEYLLLLCVYSFHGVLILVDISQSLDFRYPRILNTDQDNMVKCAVDCSSYNTNKWWVYFLAITSSNVAVELNSSRTTLWIRQVLGWWCPFYFFLLFSVVALRVCKLVAGYLDAAISDFSVACILVPRVMIDTYFCWFVKCNLRGLIAHFFTNFTKYRF